MPLPVSFATTADGIRIAYVDDGAGAPLVLVRGWVTHLELLWAEPNFRRFFEALAEQFRIVRFDARGNGLSQREVGRPDPDGFVGDVEAVIDAVGLPRVNLWGSGFGGPIAIAYAARHPDRVERLILEGTYPTWVDLRTQKQRESVGSLVRMLESAPDVAATGFSYITDPAPGTRHEERARRGLASIKPDYLAYLYALRFDVKPMLTGLTMPTLVMHAQNSQVWPSEGARLLTSAIPGARYVELAGEQHNPWEGDADTALNAICDFCGVASARTRVARHDQVVVVLFTDLVGSTDLANRLGDRVANELRRSHDDVVSDSVSAHGGSVIKYVGDGVLARFGTASAAVSAARSIVSRVHEHNAATSGPELRLRIGINAGEPIEEKGDLHGSAVNLAARVCDAAGVGDIFVTSAVRDLAAGKGFSFEDRGSLQFKGFEEAQQVYAVCDTGSTPRAQTDEYAPRDSNPEPAD